MHTIYAKSKVTYKWLNGNTHPSKSKTEETTYLISPSFSSSYKLLFSISASLPKLQKCCAPNVTVMSFFNFKTYV